MNLSNLDIVNFLMVFMNSKFLEKEIIEKFIERLVIEKESLLEEEIEKSLAAIIELNYKNNNHTLEFV